MFPLVGTAANQYCTTRAPAPAGAGKKTRGPAEARTPAIRLTFTALLLDLELALHPRVDEAHEVELAALLSRDLERDVLALLALTCDAGVARPVEIRRGVLSDAVLEELELRGC